MSRTRLVKTEIKRKEHICNSGPQILGGPRENGLFLGQIQTTKIYKESSKVRLYQ